MSRWRARKRVEVRGCDRGFQGVPRIDWSRPDLLARLGQEPDRELAAELGVSRQRIERVRQARGIQSYTAARRMLSPELVARLGTAPDLDLALEYGVRVSVVGDARRELGVAPWKVPCGLTRTTYNKGCRCEDCRRINADAQLAYNAKHPERFKATQDRCRTKALASAPHTGEDATVSKYTLGCRCDGCRAARKKWATQNRVSRLARLLVEHPLPHAPTTISWYTTGCRCEDCRTLMREHGRRLRLPLLDLSAL